MGSQIGPEETKEPYYKGRRRSVAYEVPCKDCSKITIGKTKLRVSKHKQGDLKNNIVVYTHEPHHSIDWDCATMKRTVTNCWQRRTTEAIKIRTSGQTINLDIGLQLFTVWNSILNPP